MTTAMALAQLPTAPHPAPTRPWAPLRLVEPATTPLPILTVAEPPTEPLPRVRPCAWPTPGGPCHLLAGHGPSHLPAPARRYRVTRP